MIRTLSLAVLVSIFFVSCSAYKPAATYTFDKSKTFAMDYDVVWNKVVQWFAENNTPIKTIEKASGLIATEYNLSAGSMGFCDCGKSGTYEVVSDPIGNFNVLVMKDGEGTKVTVNATYKATKTTTYIGSSAAPTVSSLSCNSTGELEKSILSYIEAGS